MKKFSVKEAAAELGLSGSLVYALCSRRKIRHERHGIGRGKILIPEDALDEYRQRSTVPAARGEGAEALPPPGRGGTFKHLDAERLAKAWAD
jgi:excisionase family DNA binding protein